ncbi:hypothetical protein NDN08_001791 [Rhodosorus marinus]|uniref:JmjC domain-containing protein n=1 Tax=Rhodosorus marinus TaxID=101924 RepID=A0AAV8URT8_9RHOD|nr:hypothetical protein NDN08_001791 [Rhodosorus marinus]
MDEPRLGTVESIPIFRPDVGEGEDDLLVFVQENERELNEFGGIRIDPPSSWNLPQVNLHEPPRGDNVKINAKGFTPFSPRAEENGTQDQGKRNRTAQKRLRIPVRDFRIMDVLKRNELLSKSRSLSSVYPPLASHADLEALYWELNAQNNSETNNAMMCTYYANEPTKKHYVQSNPETTARNNWHCGTIWNHPLSPLRSVTKPSPKQEISFSQFSNRKNWTKSPYDRNTLIFNHFGCRKAIYVLPPSDSDAFERLCEDKGISPSSDQAAAISPPDLIRRYGFKNLRKSLLKPQSYLVVAAGSYCLNVDLGFNVHETATFSIPSWLVGVDGSLKKKLPYEFMLHQSILEHGKRNRGYESKISKPLVESGRRVFKQHEELITSARKRGVPCTSLEDAGPDVKSAISASRKLFEGVGEDLTEPLDPRCSICGYWPHYSFLARLSAGSSKVFCSEHGLEQLLESGTDISGLVVIYAHPARELMRILKEALGQDADGMMTSSILEPTEDGEVDSGTESVPAPKKRKMPSVESTSKAARAKKDVEDPLLREDGEVPAETEKVEPVKNGIVQSRSKPLSDAARRSSKVENKTTSASMNSAKNAMQRMWQMRQQKSRTKRANPDSQPVPKDGD